MKRTVAFLIISSSLLLGAPANAQKEKKENPSKNEAKAVQGKSKAQDKQAAQMIAVIDPTAGNKVRGTVIFKPMEGNKVQVTARLTGLKPMSGHGFHVHQFGDLSGTDGSTAGGHFNPKEYPHGLPPQKQRHAGDLGNLVADKDGQVDKTFEVENLRLSGKNSILGRAVIIHAEPDTGQQPTGGAGSRIGYGVVGYRFQPAPKTNK